MYLVVDCESTGLPLWKEPSDDPGQPHIVDMAWTLYDADFGEIERFDAIINPGVEIPEDVVKLHGITTERAAAEGIPPAEMWAKWLEAISRAELVSGFNVSFDLRMMRILGARLTGEKWENPLPKYCTMYKSAKYLAQKYTNLGATYEAIFGEAFENAHRARPDCDAAARLFIHLKQVDPDL